MKSNRVNPMLTFSAALAGLALCVLSPTAYGHGNNPKKTSDTEPDTGPYPPPPPKLGGGPQINVTGFPVPPPNDALESILDPGVVIGVDLTLHDSLDILSKVLSEPFAVDVVSNPPVDLSPQIAVDIFDDKGSVSYAAPAANSIPAPGVLSLLGLAAAAAGRRRRRRLPRQ